MSAADVGVFQGSAELSIADRKLVVSPGLPHVGRVKRLKKVRERVAALNVTNIQCEKEVQHHLDNLPLCGSANTTASRFFIADFAVKRRSMEPLLRDSDDTPCRATRHTHSNSTNVNARLGGHNNDERMTTSTTQ